MSRSVAARIYRLAMVVSLAGETAVVAVALALVVLVS